MPLAQQLEAKPQPAHLPGIEAASVPVAPVPPATVTAASTTTTPGQAAVPSVGMSAFLLPSVNFS